MPKFEIHVLYRVGGPCEFLSASINSVQDFSETITVLYEEKDFKYLSNWKKTVPQKVKFIKYKHPVLNFNDSRILTTTADDPRRFDIFTNYVLEHHRNKWIMLVDDDMVFLPKQLDAFIKTAEQFNDKNDCFPYHGLNVLDKGRRFVVKNDEIQPPDHALFFNYNWTEDKLDINTGMERLPHLDERYKPRYIYTSPIYDHYKYLRKDIISRSEDKNFLRADTEVGQYYKKQTQIEATAATGVKIWKIKHSLRIWIMSSPRLWYFLKAVKKILSK